MKIIDYFFSFEDKIIDIQDVENIFFLDGFFSEVFIISRSDFDFSVEEIKIKYSSKKLVIMSEYPELISKWINENSLLNYTKVIEVSGKSESYLANKLCDLVTCVVETGSCVKANNLKIQEMLLRSRFGFYRVNI